MEMKPLLPPVTVNGVSIAPERIAAEAQNHPAPRGKPGHAWKAAARALALREILLAEARSCGLTPDPLELAPGQWETEDEALIRQFLDQAVTPAPADDVTLRAIYDADPDRYRAPALYEAAHILFPAAPGDAPARTAARAAAQQVLGELRAAPHRFAELAARHSACASKDGGGLLGQLSSGDTVPEFEAALATIPEGEIGAPVETRYGIHLIRLDARAKGAVLPFASVLPQLRAAYEKAAWVRASRSLIAGLVAQAQVTGIAMSEDTP